MTLENIYTLFRWFEATGGVCPITTEMNSHPDEIEALSKESKLRLEFAEADIELLTKVDVFLQQQIRKDESFNLYKASLYWLIDSYHSLSSKKILQINCLKKISTIHHLFLKTNPKEAIDYYQKEPRLNQIFPSGSHLIQAYQDQVKLDENPVKIEQLIREYTEKLQNIKLPLSLNPCIDYNDAHALTAYIVWLTRRGINEEDILGSGLLQVFLLVNFHLLSEENNPIKVFYQNLAHFAESARLSEQASLIRVEDDAFVKYNLKGQLCLDSSLVLVPITTPPLLAGYDQFLFNDLYTLFGISFLNYAFGNAYRNQTDVEVLVEALNSEEVSIVELLKFLLNSYEGNSLDNCLNFFVSLVEAKTVLKALITDRQWIMMYLVIYMEVERIFSHATFVFYMEDFLHRTDVDSETKFKLLYTLLLWSKEEEDLAKQHFLYQQLAAQLFAPPCDLLRHKKFIKILSEEYHELIIEPGVDSSSGATEESTITDSSDFSSDYGSDEDSGSNQNNILRPKSEHNSDEAGSDSYDESSTDEAIYRIGTLQLLENIQALYENQWEALVVKLLGKELFKHEDYQYLQDQWTSFEQKQYAFRRIFALPGKGENTLTELIIVKRFLFQGADFVLDDLLPVLFNLSNNYELLECQRILIDILLKHNNPLLTTKLIKGVSAVNRHWFLIDWRQNSLSLLEEAVLNNNDSFCNALLGLFEDYNLLSSDIIFEAFKKAINKNNFIICKLFLVPSVISKLNQCQCTHLFLEAMFQENIPVFEYLMRERKLFGFTNCEHQSLILTAAKHGITSVLPTLIDPLSNLNPLKITIDQALISAVEGMQWQFIEKLLELAEPNSSAFIQAWRQILARSIGGELGFFIKICDKYFTKSMAWVGIHHFIELNDLEGIIFLVNRSGNGALELEDLVAIFRIALSIWPWGINVIDFLSKIEGARALHQEYVSQAILDIIVPESQHQMLEHIYESFPSTLLPNAQTVNKIFAYANRNGCNSIQYVLYQYAAEYLDTPSTNNETIPLSRTAVTDSPTSVEQLLGSIYNTNPAINQIRLSLMPASNTIAKWPPQKVTVDRESPNQRNYWYTNGGQIPDNLTGQHLPAAKLVGSHEGLHPPHLQSTKLFINLPAKFYQAYLSIQASSNPLNLPKIGQNKNVSVHSCIERHPSFATRHGLLHPSHWQELGWASQRAYLNWLNSSMLFAFSHCNHYTSTIRLIDADLERNNMEEGATFHFKQYSPQELADNPKRTNIYSVTGFEYRGFRAEGTATISSTIPAVQHHTQLTMDQILLAAEETETTDIVLIPFGMGVFIKGRREEPQIRAAMMAGMLESLRAYEGRPITLHCCGWPDFYTQLASANNPRIRFVEGTGNDAYTIANSIQDRGDEQAEKEKIHENFQDSYRPRPLKSMLINAGDNDWTALLDNTKRPGQFFLGHTLYNQTSDEYYALVTNFTCYSIQTLIATFGNLFNANKIKQLTNLDNSSEFQLNFPDSENQFQSSLSAEQIDQIDELRTKLKLEYKSCWPYPNKDQKLNKYRGLGFLIQNAETMSIDAAIKSAIRNYPDLLLGNLSSRTADLIEELKNSADYSLTPP